MVQVDEETSANDTHKIRKVIYAHNTGFPELKVFECGLEFVEPSKAYGPSVRDCYLVHFVVKGKGILEQGGQVNSLNKNDGFVVFPGVVSYYRADDVLPWGYFWLAFNGTRAKQLLDEVGLTIDQPFFNWSEKLEVHETFAQLMAERTKSGRLDLAFLSGLCWLFSRLSIGRTQLVDANQRTTDEYVKAAVDFIENHYSKKIRLSDIADFVGINMNYLCDLFRISIGESPYHHLLSTRIDRACQLLSDQRLSIADIARSVGYEDALQFSKLFKRFKNVSPSSYRTLLEQSGSK